MVQQTSSHECNVFLNVKQTEILSGIRTYILALKLSLQIIFQRERLAYKDNQTHKDREQESTKTISEQIKKDL